MPILSQIGPRFLKSVDVLAIEFHWVTSRNNSIALSLIIYEEISIALWPKHCPEIKNGWRKNIGLMSYRILFAIHTQGDVHLYRYPYFFCNTFEGIIFGNTVMMKSSKFEWRRWWSRLFNWTKTFLKTRSIVIWHLSNSWSRTCKRWNLMQTTRISLDDVSFCLSSSRIFEYLNKRAILIVSLCLSWSVLRCR